MKKVIPFYIIYSIALVLSFIAIIYSDKGGVLLYMNENHSPFLNKLFIFLSVVVEVPVFILLAFLFLWKNYRASIQIGAVGLLTLITTILLKAFFAHPRPLVYFKDHNLLDLIKLVPDTEPILGFTSFPSGHTTAAFGMMLSMAFIFKNKWLSILFIFLALGTGLSRIYLVNHFIEDVTAGSLLGITLAILVYFILNYFKVPDKKPLFGKGMKV